MAVVLNGVVRSDIINTSHTTIFSVFVSLYDLDKFIGLLLFYLFFYILEIHRS